MKKEKTNYIGLYFATLFITLLILIAIVAVGFAVFKLQNPNKSIGELIDDTGEIFESKKEQTETEANIETEPDITETSAETVIPEETEAETELSKTTKTVNLTLNDKAGSLILANPDNTYIIPSDNTLVSVYANKNKCYVLANSGLMLDKDCIIAFNSLTSAFKMAKGVSDLIISYAYVTNEEQADLFSKYVNVYGLKKAGELMQNAGCSDHNTGLGFDLNAYRDGAVYYIYSGTEYDWLVENCYKYGFINRYPDDKTEITGVSDSWHLRYVGVEHATYIYKNSLCLEEYLTLLKNYTYDGEHLCFTGDSSNSYEIFTLDGKDGTVQLEIPENVSSYSVSGTNTGMAVVTLYYN